MQLLDCHRHCHSAEALRASAGVAIVSSDPPTVEQWLWEGFSGPFSVGIHPWDVTEYSESQIDKLSLVASRPEVVAIGETGIDTVRHQAPVGVQQQVFSAHARLSVELCKPLIIHIVKGLDPVVEVLRDAADEAKADVPPVIFHGFRGKPQMARQILRAVPNAYFSMGERFNAETLDWLRAQAPERILAETDESALQINQIISRLDLSTSEVAANVRRAFSCACGPRLS